MALQDVNKTSPISAGRTYTNEFSVSRIAFVLGFVAFAFIGLGIWSVYADQATGLEGKLASRFDLNNEDGFGTWFATLLLGVNGLLLAMVFAIDQRRLSVLSAMPWLVLAVIFFGLSIDEMLSFHERLVNPMRELTGLGGFFHFAWVIPGAVFVAIVALSFAPFLLNLPRKTAKLMILAGALFVGGAIGAEMVAAKIASDATGTQLERHLFRSISVVEEALEMLGQVLFSFALLDYVSRHVQIRLRA